MEAGTREVQDSHRDVVPVGASPRALRRSGAVEPLQITAVLLATLAVYLRCLPNGFVFDDDWLIVNNPNLGQWSFLWKSLWKGQYWFVDPQHQPVIARYRPLLSIWFSLNYHLFGLNPPGWHAAMVAVHLLVVWLVYKAASRLSGDHNMGLFTALLFGLLPLHAEAVVWAAGFGLVLSGGFTLAAFYMVMVMDRDGESSQTRDWALAVGFYAAALLSHETALTFPALVAAYAFLLGSPGTRTPESGVGMRVRRALLTAAPFAAEVLLYLVARRLVLGFIAGNPTTPANHATIAQLMMTVPGVLAGYLALLIVPWWAGPVHRIVIVRSLQSPDFYLPFGALIGVGCIIFLTVRNSARWRFYLFCLAWIAISIAMLTDLRALRVDQLVHDNYLYIASFGWCLMLVDWAVRMARQGAVARWLVWAGATGVTVVCAISLWSVQPLWHDEPTLFTYGASRFPEAAIYVDWLQSLQQEQVLQNAVRLDPNNSAALYDLGHVHSRLGRNDQAVSEIARALKLMPGAPPEAYVELAELYNVEGEQEQEEAVLKQMRSMPGGDEPVAMVLARTKVREGDPSGAEKIMRDLVSRHPSDQRVWTMLGLLLAGQDRNDEALTAFKQAQALAPDDERPHFFAAQALHALGRDQEALDQCRQVLAVDPASGDAAALMAEIKRASGLN